MIKRQIEKAIKKAQKEYPIVLLTGPRQSGKTTLVKEMFSRADYVNLEDLEAREFADSDPKGFLAGFEGTVIIDEVQRVPKLLSQIQVMVDQEKSVGRFVLTGSQNMLLMEGVSQSLAGRVAIFHLLPLALAELKSSGLPVAGRRVEDFMFKGMYPRLYDKKMDTSAYYSNYLQTYVERDVRLIKNITDLSAFKRFLDLCAGRCGQILNYSSLATDAGITQSTAKEWLAILEAGFVVYLLRPHYKNFSKRVVKMPKLYFYDTGLVCSLLGITSPETLNDHYLRGGIFESFVISEFIKYRQNKGLDSDVYYWRNKTGQEIDLLLESEGRQLPVEIKSGQTISADYFKGLEYYNKLSGGNGENSWVIYAGKSEQARESGKVLPWHKLADIQSEFGI